MQTQSTSTRLAQHLLARGQAALQGGRRAEALASLRQAVTSNPNCVDALLWLAGLCDDPTDSLRHLTRALTLDPQNEAAHDGIRWARKRLYEQSTQPANAVPRFLDNPVSDSTRAKTGTPQRASVPVESPFSAPYMAAGGRPSAPTVPPSTPTITRPSADSAQPSAAFSMKPSPAAMPRQAAPTRSAAKSGVRIPKQLAIGVMAFWAAILIFVSGSIIWLAVHPASALKPEVVSADEPEAPLAPTAVETSVAAVAPTAEPTLDTSQIYAQRANDALAQLDSAWAQEDWERAIPLIAQALAFRPGDTELQRKLMSAYFNRAVQLMDNGDLDNALKAYDQALAVVPGEEQVKVERDALVNYMAGLEQFNERNWASAVQHLTKVSAVDSGYLDTREMLYRAYYYQGVALRAAKDLNGAFKAFQAAVDLDELAIEARGELAQVKAALAPPTATPTRPPAALGAKWIDVNITTQRFRAMRGNTVAFTFVTSTGEKGRDTQPGNYKILDKIPNAWSRFWDLWMPYWMGIYWAGNSENGIHALPILKSGQTLWAGFLGRKVSFGCVILDTAAAKQMFSWAEIGTPVIIHY